MSFLSFQCNQLFGSADFHQSKISIENFEQHHTQENAWIAYDSYVFSIQKDDSFLLELFKEHYAKNIKLFLKTFPKSTQLEIYQKLRPRFIGYLST
jgi:hypothetical protein